ncbi:MAG: YihY/virulence factor BrkB family protein [Bacteroidales bacterium]|jgi:membrane protein|nr:YihY/virulence factor BrkB family protein [Bacteroidales bacterium]MDD4702912.1 YihY/virulence factor BrkB family protein [Bacteroidales bacterium]MDX9797965.1 YihY/virulence factor BrkB family protein [Bacteroidales bacterium]
MPKKQNKILRRFLYWRPIRNILHFSRLIVLPGFQGVPLFDVLFFFIQGLAKGFINQRAAALAYHFVLATFPLLLFFFTLLPYVPIESLYLQLIEFIESLVPESISEKVISVINGIFLKKNQGLMSIGFISSIYVASSGINAMMMSFNSSKYNTKKRSWIKRRLISIGLVFAIGLVVILSFTLIVGSTTFFNFLLKNSFIQEGIILFLLQSAKWLLLIALVYIMFVMIYYYTPADKSNFKFFSAGATLATILFILSISGFNFYISNFSRYNALYGSIGALIIFLLWFYLISYILIIGYELNASIAYAVGERVSKKDSINEEEGMSISRSAGNKSIYRRWDRIIRRIIILLKRRGKRN